MSPEKKNAVCNNPEKEVREISGLESPSEYDDRIGLQGSVNQTWWTFQVWNFRFLTLVLPFYAIESCLSKLTTTAIRPQQYTEWVERTWSIILYKATMGGGCIFRNQKEESWNSHRFLKDARPNSAIDSYEGIFDEAVFVHSGTDVLTVSF